jgi:hypothetical protein
VFIVSTSADRTTSARKPLYKRGWFWLIVAVIVIAAIASSQGSDDGATGATPSTGGPQSSAPAAEQPAADDPLSDDGWTVSDIQIETTAIGPSISGRVTNNEDETRTGVWTLTVFSNGQRVYDAMGSASDVEAGSTATVTFVGTSQDEIAGDPATFTYELQSDI